METSVNQFRCPLCHSIDSVAKVSSIYDTGSATSVGYHAAGRASGRSVTISTTALASKLAPPSLPRFRVVAEGYENGCGVALFVFLGLCLAGVGWLFIAIFSAWYGALMILFGLGIILGLISGFIIVAIQRKEKRPGWQRAMAIWERLYYCARNDVVFLPDAPQQCVPASQLSTLLYPPQA